MALPSPPHSRQCWDKQTLVVSRLFNILICMDAAKTFYPNETLSNFFCLFYCSSFQMVEALIPFLMRPTDFTHLSHTTLEWKSLQCWTTWGWFRWSTLLELRSGMNKWDSGFLELYFGFHSNTIFYGMNKWDSGFLELYFRIPQAKISRISESGFPYMGCKT